MIGLLLKIATRFAMVAIALSAGLILIVVILVFSGGTSILHDRTFVGTVEIVAFFIPIASALILIPNTIRENQTKKMGGSAEG